VNQAFGREAKGADEFRAINASFYGASLHTIRVFSIFGPALDLLTTSAVAVVIWVGGAQVLAGTLTFGTLYAFTAYLRMLFGPVNALAEKYNILQAALAAAERLTELVNTAPEIADPAPELAASLPPRRSIRPDGHATAADRAAPALSGASAAGAGARPGIVDRAAADRASTAGPPADGASGGHAPAHGDVPAVVFDDVWFAYQADQWVLRGVSFAVMPGETVAFVGHTGAGKSTIMNLVPRLYDVQQGAVRVLGRDVREVTQSELRQRVGLVMQDVFLFAGDVAANVHLGDPRLSRADVERAARAVGADTFIARLPGGLDEPVVERGLSLSAGQRQLISFARALAYDPEILILDEATASIDSETEAALQRAIGAVSRARTTLIVAHRLATVRGADRIYVMHHGRIVEVGDHVGLLARDGLYRKLWDLQFAGRPPTGA
jgi:ATP-binding cassette, subfamily B, multidrug efflux pump